MRKLRLSCLGLAAILILSLVACGKAPVSTSEVRVLTAAPLPTYTPYPTLVPLPTYTPYPTLKPLATYTPYPSPTVPPTPTIPPTPSAGTRKNPAKIGDSLTFEYSDASYAITVTKTIAGAEAWKRIKAANMFNDPAKEGYEYVLFYAVAQIVNGPADESIGIGESLVKMVDETGQIWSLGGVVDPSPEFGGKGFVGATIQGWSSIIRTVGAKVYLVFGMDFDGKGGVWFEVPA